MEQQKIPFTSAVIVAAGRGTRMGTISKPEVKLNGKPILNWVIDAFLQSNVQEIIVVCGANRPNLEKLIPQQTNIPIRLCNGGDTRSESVFNGVNATSKSCVFACVHDCARPFITPEIIENVLSDAYETGAATACTPTTDTVKYVDKDHNTIYTPNRDYLLSMQTPQAFRKDQYQIAYALARKKDARFTDETALLEYAGIPVSYTICPSSNIKLTTKEDILLARAILLLQKKEQEQGKETT